MRVRATTTMAPISSTDPGEIRDAVVSDLMAATGAQAGNWYTLWRDRDRRCLVAGENRFQGPRAVAEALREIEGKPYMPVHLGETREELAGQLGMLTQANAFQIQTTDELPEELTERFWRPGEIHCSLGLNAVISDRYAGWIGVFRTRPHPKFEPDLPARLQPRVPAYLQHLDAARAIESARSEGGAVLVVRGGIDIEGQVPCVGVGVGSPGIEERVTAEITSLLGTDSPSRTFMSGSTEVRLLRLAGEEEEACAVVMRSHQEPDISRVLRLSKRLRQVLSLAVQDLTVSEIGARLDLSQETIRDHIRALYDHLGIGSRAEMALVVRHLTDAGSSGADGG